MHGYHQRGRMTDDNGVIVHDPATTVAIDFAKVPILSFLSARRVVLGSPASKPARGNLFSPWDRRVVLGSPASMPITTRLTQRIAPHLRRKTPNPMLLSIGCGHLSQAVFQQFFWLPAGVLGESGGVDFEIVKKTAGHGAFS